MNPIICNDCIDFIETGRVGFDKFNYIDNFKTMYYYNHTNYNCIISSIYKSCIDFSFVLELRANFVYKIDENVDTYFVCASTTDESKLKSVIDYRNYRWDYIVIKTENTIESLNSLLKKIEYSLLLG